MWVPNGGGIWGRVGQVDGSSGFGAGQVLGVGGLATPGSVGVLGVDG